ncbi:MAG: DUF2721 domain-containing protein [Bacteroidota bacterium]
MNDAPVTAIEAIQAMLAPAVGISAVGLLLLALTNRYSTLINRIRLLNEEKRRLVKIIAEQGDLNYTDQTRYMSVVNQGKELLRRSTYLRNAILSMQSAIGMFVLTSALIGVNMFVTTSALRDAPLITFIIGMIAVFVGILYSATDVIRSLRIVLLEVKADE